MSDADGLNRAQRTAVTTLSGPLLVLAGAGTGKTRVITFRIAELITSGIVPNRILAMTFTNKAAKEMRERASQLLKSGRKKKKRQKGPEISTFHSLCVRILRRNAKVLGYPENFTIYDRGDQESIARTALRDIRVGAQTLRPGDLIHQISTWKSASITPEEAQRISTVDRDILASQAYEKYQASLRMSGAMDFDDLLTCTEKLLDEHPEVRFAEASRFDHVLIDEYQDTSGIQYRIVRALAERHRNICVVGDDDQSIYGWRGAEVEHILGFKDQWPDAKVVKLEENYRSTGWIIHLANTLIAHNSVRHDKVLKAFKSSGEPPRFVPYEDENHEAEAVVSEIFRRINREGEERTPASDIAILFRTNEQPRAFEQEMRRAGVPYRLVGGQSFFDRKEIKDMLSYLRILANPADEVSLLRIINTPPRGIGQSGVKVLLDEAVGQGVPLWNVLDQAEEHPDVPAAASRAIEDFRQMMDEFRARVGSIPLPDLLIELIDRSNYKAELERQYKDPSEQETRWNAVQELVNAATNYEQRDENPSLIGFLEESSLSDKDDDNDDDRQEHAVTLMTLHSAKGLEFPIVYLVGLEEGLLPHKRSLMEDANTIPEERRLAYVGVTRAREQLTLSFCKGRMKWGKLRAQIPSRFLMEMRGETEKAKNIAAQSAEEFAKEKERIRAQDEKDAAKKEKAKKKRKKQPSEPPVGTPKKDPKSESAQKKPTLQKVPEPGHSSAAKKTPGAPDVSQPEKVRLQSTSPSVSQAPESAKVEQQTSEFPQWPGRAPDPAEEKPTEQEALPEDPATRLAPPQESETEGSPEPSLAPRPVRSEPTEASWGTHLEPKVTASKSQTEASEFPQWPGQAPTPGKANQKKKEVEQNAPPAPTDLAPVAESVGARPNVGETAQKEEAVPEVKVSLGARPAVESQPISASASTDPPPPRRLSPAPSKGGVQEVSASHPTREKESKREASSGRKSRELFTVPEAEATQPPSSNHQTKAKRKRASKVSPAVASGDAPKQEQPQKAQAPAEGEQKKAAPSQSEQRGSNQYQQVSLFGDDFM